MNELTLRTERAACLPDWAGTTVGTALKRYTWVMVDARTKEKNSTEAVFMLWYFMFCIGENLHYNGEMITCRCYISHGIKRCQ